MEQPKWHQSHRAATTKIIWHASNCDSYFGSVRKLNKWCARIVALFNQASFFISIAVRSEWSQNSMSILCSDRTWQAFDCVHYSLPPALIRLSNYSTWKVTAAKKKSYEFIRRLTVAFLSNVDGSTQHLNEMEWNIANKWKNSVYVNLSKCPRGDGKR